MSTEIPNYFSPETFGDAERALLIFSLAARRINPRFGKEAIAMCRISALGESVDDEGSRRKVILRGQYDMNSGREEYGANVITRTPLENYAKLGTGEDSGLEVVTFDVLVVNSLSRVLQHRVDHGVMQNYRRLQLQGDMKGETMNFPTAEYQDANDLQRYFRAITGELDQENRQQSIDTVISVVDRMGRS